MAQLDSTSKILLFLLAFSTITASSTVQDHAPSVEQCRNDAVLWAVDANDHNKNVPVMKIVDRLAEMTDCQIVDPDLYSGYHRLFISDLFTLHDRRRSFMVRHHLEAQFLAEDAKAHP